MYNKNKKYSINLIFSVILISVVTTVMTLLLTYNYHKTKDKLYQTLNNQSHITLERLSKSITPFIESYAINEYQNLIYNEMQNKDIVSVIVKDELTGTILGKNPYFTGKIRDANWLIKEYEENDTNKEILESSFLKLDKTIISQDGSKLADISLYYTDRFIIQELNGIIKESIVVIFSISLTLTIFLFITISEFILSPIMNISNTLNDTDKAGFPKNDFKEESVAELSVLIEKINFMIEKVKESKKILSEYIERYELTLSAINDGIWDWNIQTNEVYFSKRWKNMLGYAEDEFEDKPEAFFNAIHEQDQERVQKILNKHFENPEKNIYSLEIRVKTKDGNYKWILSRGKAALDKSGKPLRMVGSHTDITDKKVDEEQLKQILQQFEQAKKVGKLGIWEIDFKTNSFYWSKEFYDLMGLDYTIEASYEKFLQCVHEDDREEIDKGYQKIFTEKIQHQELEFRFVLSDGTIRYVKAFTATTYDENQNPLKDIGAVYDVTELVRERDFISTIVDNANAIIAVIDTKGTMFRINEYGEKFTGYTQEEISSEPFFWSRFLPEDKRANILNIIENANKGNITKSFKNGWVSKTGEERMFEWSNMLVQKKDGSMDYLATIGLDVTEKEQALSAVLKQKQEFETIFNYAQDGITIIDLDGNFLKFNDAFMKLTEYTYDELMKLNCSEITAFEDRIKNQEVMELAIKLGHVENFEKKCMVKSGNIINVNMSISLLPDKQTMLLIIKNTTSLKMLEEQAKLASMGEMIGNIAHQWRQPLSIISTSASGLKAQSEYGIEITPDKINEFSDLIVQQSEYLSKTIDNFRDFIKGDKSYKEVNIIKVLEYTLNIINASLANNYITVVKDFQDDLVIYGSINELSEALINIINNAKDVLKEIKNQDDRFLFITTKLIEKNTIEIKIKDTGGGINSKIINRVFEPYFTTKHQSIGTGLGLSMANQIICTRHKGELVVTNEKFQYNEKTFQGACFTITLYNNSSS